MYKKIQIIKTNYLNISYGMDKSSLKNIRSNYPAQILRLQVTNFVIKLLNIIHYITVCLVIGTFQTIPLLNLFL